MSTSEGLTLCELNVNGLGSREKQEDLAPWLKRVADVVVLTDTRIKADHNFWSQLRASALAAADPAGRARGVAVVSFRDDISFTEVAADGSGRLLRMRIKRGQEEVMLVAAYLPAQADSRGAFMRDHFKVFCFDLAAEVKVILAGDLNLVEDPCIDKTSKLGSVGENDRMLAALPVQRMKDAFRALYPMKEYTFYSKSAKESSRIDRVLVSSALLHRVPEVHHVRPQEGTTDHSFGVRLTLNGGAGKKEGPGLWRLQARQVSKPGVRAILKRLEEKRGPNSWEDYEEFTLQAGAGLRPYAVQENKRIRSTLAHLRKEVSDLSERHMGDPKCVETAIRYTARASQLRAYEKAEKEKLMTRAGVEAELESETPSKYLSSKVKVRKAKASIGRVQHEGRMLEEPREILAAATYNFRKAFGGLLALGADPEWLRDEQKKLSEADKQKLLESWREKEVLGALKELAKDKVSGLDGLPKELFEQNWDVLGAGFMGFVKAFEETGTIPAKISEAATILLHKKGDKEFLQNYRPITLLNSTYKILAKVLANRMKSLMHKVVSEEQFGFLPGRRLGDAVAIVADVIDAARNGDEDWFLLLVDFEKAYDTVRRGFLFETLRRMGFPEGFIGWVEGLHRASTMCLCVNGWIRDMVEVGVGVRQGCPLAPYLFLCAIEPLCQEASRRKLGLSKKGAGRLSYLGYADDTTLILNGRQQLEKAVVLLEDFGNWSGLKINKAKSVVLPLGKNVRSRPPASTQLKWVKQDEAERLLGIWISPSGDAVLTWEKALERATGALSRWKGAYLSTSARVTILNAYIMPIFIFPAQVYPPPAGVWKRIKKLSQNFVSGNQADLDNHFVLWSYKLMCTAREDGGLGVIDPKARLDSVALRNTGVMALQGEGIKRELTNKAAGLAQGWATLYSHETVLKHGVGSQRWKGIAEAYMRTPQLQVKPASDRWEVEQERLLFNANILKEGGRLFGTGKRESGLLGKSIGDLVVKEGDGTRAIKITEVLSRELGSKKAAVLAARIFEAAPEEWREMVLTPLMATEVVERFGYVMTRGFTGKDRWCWEVKEACGAELRCELTRINDGRCIVQEGEPVGSLLSCMNMVPIVVSEGIILGEAGDPRTRILGTAIRQGTEVAATRSLRTMVASGEKLKQRLAWEQRRGGVIDWKKVLRMRDTEVTPVKGREVLLRFHCMNLQVGERLSFLGDRSCCPHCKDFETLDHCLFSCPVIRPVMEALMEGLCMLNPARQADSLEDLLFGPCGTRSGFPEAGLVAITMQKVWKERCDAVFRGETFQKRRVLGGIVFDFSLHVRTYMCCKSLGQLRCRKGQVDGIGLGRDEAVMLDRVRNTAVSGVTWNGGFQSIWTNPRTFERPP